MNGRNLREVFAAAAEAWVSTVEALDESSWGCSALGAWDTRALVGHTLRAFATIDRFLAGAASGREPEIADAVQYYRTVLAQPAIHDDVERRGVDAGIALGDAPARAVRAAVTATLSALDGADDSLVGPTAAGSMTLGEYLATRLVEVAVHHADLCAARDVTPPQVDGVWEEVLAVVAATATSSQARVATLALLGREPLPAWFNLFAAEQG